jgi:hypothetical protein
MLDLQNLKMKRSHTTVQPKIVCHPERSEGSAFLHRMLVKADPSFFRMTL